MTDQKQILSTYNQFPLPLLIIEPENDGFVCRLVNKAFTEAFRTASSGFSEPTLPGILSEAGMVTSRDIEGILKRLDRENQLTDSNGNFSEIYFSHPVSEHRPDGLGIWDIQISPIPDTSGLLILTFIDKSELRTVRNEKRQISRHVEEHFVLLDKDMRILNFNEKFAEQYRLVFGKEISKYDSMEEITLPQRRNLIRKIGTRVLRGETLHDTLEVPVQDGIRTFRVTHKPARNEKGEIFGVFVTMLEQTDKVEARNELIRNKKRFQAMVENSKDIVVILNEEGTPTYVSPSVKGILGYSVEEALEMNINTAIHPDDLPVILTDIQNALENPDEPVQGLPARIRHKDGSWRWVEGVLTNLLDDESVNGIVDNFRDVTDRVLAEQDLIKANLQYESLIQTVDGIVWESDADSELFNFVSPQIEEMLGISPAVWKTEKRAWQQQIHPEDREWVLSYCRNQIRDQKNHTIEYRLKTREGQYKWVRDVISVIADESNTPLLRGLMIDITPQKVAEKDREDERRDKEALINSTDDMIWSVDRELNLVAANNALIESIRSQIGIEPEPGTSIFTGLDEYQGYIKMWKGYYKRAFSGESFRVENSEPEDGTMKPFWLETSFNPIFEGDKVTGVACFSRDITEAKHTRKKLEEAESKLRDIVEHSTNMFYRHTADHVLTYVSPQSKSFLGVEPEDARRRWTEFITDNPLNEEGFKLTQKAIDTGKTQPPYELELIRPDGEIIWVEVNEAPLVKNGKTESIIGSLTNITDRKRNEQSLEESNKRYNVVSKATSDIIWDMDFKENSMQYNDNIETMLGYKHTEFKSLEEWWKDKIHPDDRQVVKDTLDVALTNKNQRFQIQYRFKASDGTYRHIYDRAFVLRDSEGDPVRMIGAMQDVTREVEEKERLKLLESVITHTSESVVILEANPSTERGRTILYVNEAFSAMTGFSPEESLGNTLGDIFDLSFSKKEFQYLMLNLEGMRAFDAELPNRRKNGEKFWCNISMVPVANNEEEYTHWVMIGRDITEQKKREQEIRESLAEKEILLSEIHHRVKNNLAVVSGMMQLQAFDTSNADLKDKLYDSMTRIKTMATVHEILYRSKNFSKLDFADNIRKLMDGLNETLETDTKISMHYHCDEVNLNINQAIPASLIVNEVTTNIHKHAFEGKDKGEVKVDLSLAEDLIRLEITDNGNGLPNDFDYTSNNTLGLHLIKVLAQQINADYEYLSTPEKTTFKISFRLSDKQSGVGNARMEAE